MENTRVFIGNLDFAITESEVRNLLSRYGTVVDIEMHQKKGYAIIEMGSHSEAASAVEKLDGVKYREREIRSSFEMKAGRAKTESVKRYKENKSNASHRVRNRSGNNTAPGDKTNPDRGDRKPEIKRDSKKKENLDHGYGSRKDKKMTNDSSNLKMKESKVQHEKESKRGTDRQQVTEAPDSESRESFGSYGRMFKKFLEKSQRESSLRQQRDFSRERSEETRGSEKERSGEKTYHTRKKISDGWKEKPAEKSAHGKKNTASAESSRKKSASTAPRKQDSGRGTEHKPGHKPGNSARGRNINRKSNHD